LKKIGLIAKYYFIDEPETGLIDGYYVNKRPEVELRIWNERRPQFRPVIEMNTGVFRDSLKENIN